MVRCLILGIGSAFASLVGFTLYKAYLKSRSSPIYRLYTSEDPFSSSIVIHKGIVYLSSIYYNEGDIEEQTLGILQSMEELLGDAGSNKYRILDVQIQIRNIERNFEYAMTIWREWMDEGYKGALSVSESRFLDPDRLIQIKVIAAQ